jgi:hypothetical protein
LEKLYDNNELNDINDINNDNINNETLYTNLSLHDTFIKTNKLYGTPTHTGTILISLFFFSSRNIFKRRISYK